MSDFEFLFSSFGLLFAAGGVVVWFYVRRVKQAHRHISQRLSGILNMGGDDDEPAPSQPKMPSFAFPAHLKVLVIVLLLASAVFLALAIVGLTVTLMKVALVVAAVVLWLYLLAFIWRRVGERLGRRRGKVWYEDD